MLPTLTPRLSRFVLLALLVLSGWSIYLTRPPQAKPTTAPLTEFSAQRAMRHVRQIAREPHAMGTPGHARVRAYLLTALRSLGLKPLVQEATVAGRPTNPQSFVPSGTLFGLAYRVGHVYNVLARLRGRGPDKARPRKAVLLVAHYDSQPNTLGAADDGSGVAAILEAVRAIQQGGPLQHDVILLFTDGEEYGLYGARAFRRHPWANDVGFMINLESRGNSGPSTLFETSAQNGWVIDQVTQSVPHPVASSLGYEVYKRLPNTTDFTILREGGYAGVNTAFIDGFIHYHKLTDSPQNLNPNSLQHQGENLLALTRHVGNVSLARTKAPDKVFFNGAGHWLITYPMAINWLWMALLTVAFVTALAIGFRQPQLGVGQFIGGLGACLLVLLLIGGFCLLVQAGILWALPLTHVFNGTYGPAQFFGAFALLTVGLFGLLVRLAGRRLRPLSLTLGGYSLVFGLTVTLFFLLPAGTYLFLFPLLGALTGLLLTIWPTRRTGRSRPVHALILLIGALPALFIILPLVQALYVTFDLQLPAVPMLLLSVVLLLLLPLWLPLEAGLRWGNRAALPVVALLLGGVMMVVALRNEAPSAGQPLHSQVSYFLNADTGRAIWASYALLGTDDWNRQFFPASSEGALTEMRPASQPEDQRVFRKNTAPAIADAPPVARLVADRAVGAGRQLQFELRSGRGAAHLEMVLFAGRGGSVQSIRLNGESVPIRAQPTTVGPAVDLLLTGLPVTKTITLTVNLPTRDSLRLLLADQSIGLPASLIKIPRPAYVVPEQGSLSNLTVIEKTYSFR